MLWFLYLILLFVCISFVESSTPRVHMGGNKFHEVFQLRPGNYYDLPAAKITEMMKSNSLDVIIFI